MLLIETSRIGLNEVISILVSKGEIFHEAQVQLVRDMIRGLVPRESGAAAYTDTCNSRMKSFQVMKYLLSRSNIILLTC
jgi:hypothetical protein